MVDAGWPFKPWDDRPSIPLRLMWVWEAFHELQTCRPVGMAPGPIPWTAINEFARAREVAEVARFERLIRALDLEFLSSRRQSDSEETKPGDRRGTQARDFGSGRSSGRA